MNNILKKMKNVNMFTKLVGLVVIFSVASCDKCKDKDKDKATVKLLVEPTSLKVTGDNAEVKLKMKVDEGVAKVEDYTLHIDDTDLYSADDSKTGKQTKDATNFLELAPADASGKTMKDLTGGAAELKKGESSKEVTVKLTGKGNVKSAKVKFELKKGTEVVDTKIVEWKNA